MPRIRNGGSLFESDKAIRVARHYHLDVGIVPLDVRLQPVGDVKHQVLLKQPIGADCARIVTAVTSVNYDLANLQA